MLVRRPKRRKELAFSDLPEFDNRLMGIVQQLCLSGRVEMSYLPIAVSLEIFGLQPLVGFEMLLDIC